MKTKPSYESLAGRVQTLEREAAGRDRLEKELKNREATLRSILSAAPVGIGMTSNRQLIDVNARICEMVGYTRDELVGQNARILYPSDDEYDFVGREKYDQINKTGTGWVETRWRRKDGALITIILSSTPLDPGNLAAGVTFTALDITARKITEQALRESEERYRQLVHFAPAGIFEVDVATAKFISVNQAMCEFTGYSREELLQSGPFDLAAKESKARLTQRFADIRAGKPSPPPEEYKMRTRNGHEYWVLVNTKYFTQDGAVRKVTGVAHDLTEIRMAREALRESEEKYRHLFEMESDAIFLIRKDDGRILETNTAATRMYGYSREDLLTMKNTDLSAEPEATRRATSDQLQEIPIRWHRKKDGTVFPVEITASHLSWKGDSVHIAAIRDITFRIESEKERAKLEEELRHTQKMEAIGTLSGGIAHDFNNILSIIMGNTELALEDIPDWNPAHHNLAEVRKACLQARDLIRQILAFSRHSNRELKPVRLGQLAAESLKLLRASIPTTVEIRQHLRSTADTIRADATQINQVLINLCMNAAHAMRGGTGILTVSLEDLPAGKDTEAIGRELPADRCVQLTVSDTGHGIPPDVMERIFDPYFTTKPVGEGSGMGLAVVHGIVQNHGGTISVHSRPGAGSTFQIVFPVVETAAEPAPAEADRPAGGRERLLVVDDEESVAVPLQQVLERLGYHVDVRFSSLEALAHFKNEPQAYDLVITDQTMPRMTGEALAVELLKINPSLPVILCTGYSEMVDESRAKSVGIRAFVLKPVVVKEIAAVIRAALDETSHRPDTALNESAPA